MAKEDFTLIVTAHPDDETIFFAGLILSRPKTRWKVVCATDGNADDNGLHRIEDLKKACEKLGITSVETLGFPDRFEQRLDTDLLQEMLIKFHPQEVFTHGILGEYGHPHHQDVALATHKAFSTKCPVYSVAHNCFPDFKVALTRKVWEIKSEIYRNCYFTETRRFIQMLPITFTEGFSKVTLHEVEAIYNYLIGREPLDKKALSYYAAIEPYFEDIASDKSRPF